MASLRVSGSQRAPSPVRNQPLKSVVHTAFGSLAAEKAEIGGTSPDGAVRASAPLGQPIADRARRRQLEARMQLPKLVPQLLGAPAIVSTQRQYIVHQLRLTRSAMLVRRPAAVLQTLHPFALVPPQQRVPRLAADPGLRTQLLHHRPFLLRRQHKPHPLFHDAGLFPRHRQALLPSIETCQPCIRSKLSGIYPSVPSPSLSPKGERNMKGRSDPRSD